MTLTDEILDNISAYNMESIDAESNVIKAHMEATMRDIRIATECDSAGIIMESSDWDGNIIPKRDGENILKYIFLFIPRIIINICRKIHAWWTGLKQKNIDKALAEGDEEIFKDLAAELMKFCTNINQRINGKVSYTGNQFVYMSRIKDINAIDSTYGMFKQRFDTYKNTVVSISEMDDAKQAETMVVSAIEASAPVSEDLVSTDYIYPVNVNGFLDTFRKMDKTVKEIIADIQRSMLDIENRYKVMLSKHVSVGDAINMSTLERYMKNIEKVENVFNRFSMVSQRDIEEMVFVSKTLSEKIPLFRQELLKRRPTPTERKDYAEKLDKWGVK